MAERVEKVGDLFLVETIQEPVQEETKPEPKVKCSHCGKPSADQFFSLGWKNRDGFTIHWPTCKHDSYKLCPSCTELDDTHKCPVCGCEAEYC